MQKPIDISINKDDPTNFKQLFLYVQKQNDTTVEKSTRLKAKLDLVSSDVEQNASSRHLLGGLILKGGEKSLNSYMTILALTIV